MSRAERLLEVLQILRGYRRPVSGVTLASKIGVSLRTLYRDIASLRAQGAAIDGEAGVGYMLRPGFMLPPLMFPAEEIEALVLGSRWVADHGDDRLSAAARSALARISTVLPPERKGDIEASAMLVGPRAPIAVDRVDLAVVRDAIRNQRKLLIAYRDGGDIATDRIIWPFALAFFETRRILVGWCELRGDVRHFRTDRITTADPEERRYPTPRAELIRRWRESRGITRPWD
jgi:predicted DNA-binding transcriptional regulator YafY